MRQAVIGILTLCVSSVAQAAPEPDRAQVQIRLRDTQVRLQQISDMFNRLNVQYAKLNVVLSDRATQSSAWNDMQSAQPNIVNGVKEFLVRARNSIDFDRKYLNGTLNAADYQAASRQLAHATAQTISALIQPMERQATAAKALPQPDRSQRSAFIEWSMALHRWESLLDTTVRALEDEGRAWRNRADDCCL